MGSSKRPQVTDESQLIRFGIIGPGRAAARFAEGLTAVPNATLHSVWGRNPAKTQAFAQKHNVPQTPATLDQFLATDIDAVYVATHPDTHADLCIQALAAAHQNNRLFMEAMKPPFFPLYERLRQHLADDPIGPVGFVRAGHCDSTLAPDHPLHFPELGGGGIMGIGPYEAFLALDWLGPLKRVHTLGRLNAAGVDSFALIHTEHENGMAQLYTGLDLLSHGDALLSAPRGYVLIHANWWNPTRATIHYLDRRQVELHVPFESGGFNYETDHFCQLIRSGLRESPIIPHNMSLGMAHLLESARKALGVHFPTE